MWKGVLAYINAKCEIRAARKIKTAKRMVGNGFCYIGWMDALKDVLWEEIKKWAKNLIRIKR